MSSYHAYKSDTYRRNIQHLKQRIAELERLCKTEFEEMTDADYSAWEDVAGRAKIAELERHQEALYKALQTARQERVEAVKKFNDVTPFVDWPRYHKRMEARDE